MGPQRGARPLLVRMHAFPARMSAKSLPLQRFGGVESRAILLEGESAGAARLGEREDGAGVGFQLARDSNGRAHKGRRKAAPAPSPSSSDSDPARDRQGGWYCTVLYCTVLNIDSMNNTDDSQYLVPKKDGMQRSVVSGNLSRVKNR
jgi:hypothetical protein